MTCPRCGGDMIGDGYTLVMHCENADEEAYFDHEPDASPVYCSFQEHEKMEVNMPDRTSQRIKEVVNREVGLLQSERDSWKSIAKAREVLISLIPCCLPDGTAIMSPVQWVQWAKKQLGYKETT